MEWWQTLDAGAMLAAAAAWVKRLDIGEYLFLAGIPLALGLLLGALAAASFWLSGALKRQRPVPMNRLTPGYHMIRGKARGPMLESPFTRRPCVWWKIRVWEAQVRVIERRNSDGEREREQVAVWDERRHEVSEQPIQCVDGLLGCAVDPAGITLIAPSEVREWEGPGPEPQDRNPPVRQDTVLPMYGREVGNYSIVKGELRRENRYRYAEEIIVPGSELFALGQVDQIDHRQAGEGGMPLAPDLSWRIGLASGRSSLQQVYLVSARPIEQVLRSFNRAPRAMAILGAVFLAVGGFMVWARLAGG